MGMILKNFYNRGEYMKSKGNTIDNLKTQFDKVFLKHDVEGRRTVAILLNGTTMHVGISKIHENDELNRPKGRLISLGRAVHANLVYNGKRQLRTRETKRKVHLAFTIEAGNQENIEKNITDLFSGTFFK